ncbi:MAG: formamidopyrimidine-DNA glycosylase [Planctomycetes bacterium]|nr:formamidopyrimidine-DNA glycosylase [Planctomycetota bacterium]
MPELPDITIYIEALERCVLGRELVTVSVRSPFLVRTFDPPIEAIVGRRVDGIERLGKRIVFVLGETAGDRDPNRDWFLVLHLMIAGRLRWRDPDAKPPGGKALLATFGFSNGRLCLTEASSKKRASAHVVRSREELGAHDPGGLELFDCTEALFAERLGQENRTLKRALTSPRLFSGIGNAYSDEILHRARLSPVKWTSRLSPDEVARLFVAVREVMAEWIDRFREQVGSRFPEKVTAFRPEMAVHGKFKEPCPVCGAPVQRIVYADNETNYCAVCQTEGVVLKDRALSRLLREDWPRTIEEWE